MRLCLVLLPRKFYQSYSSIASRTVIYIVCCLVQAFSICLPQDRFFGIVKPTKDDNKNSK